MKSLLSFLLTLTLLAGMSNAKAVFCHYMVCWNCKYFTWNTTGSSKARHYNPGVRADRYWPSQDIGVRTAERTILHLYNEFGLADLWHFSFAGFALNVGDPTQPFVQTSLDYMFSYAQSIGFKLYISIDLYASGNACCQRSPQCTEVCSPTQYERKMGANGLLRGIHMFPEGSCWLQRDLCC